MQWKMSRFSLYVQYIRSNQCFLYEYSAYFWDSVLPGWHPELYHPLAYQMLKWLLFNFGTVYCRDRTQNFTTLLFTKCLNGYCLILGQCIARIAPRTLPLPCLPNDGYCFLFGQCIARIAPRTLPLPCFSNA